MSQYTLTVKQLIENDVDIFNFYFPMFDEKHRSVLITKIIRHYYFYEIGCETVGRFIFNLNTKMNEIMPYYNQRYLSTLHDYEVLFNYDMKETFNRDVVGDSSTVGKNDGENKNLFSDTPNGRINIDDNNFVTNLTKDILTSSSNMSGNTTSKETTELTRKGNIGVMSAMDLIQKDRDIMINVDMEVINELKELFMLVW